MLRLRGVAVVVVGMVVVSAPAAEIWTDIGGMISWFDSDNPSVVTSVGDTGELPMDGMDFTSDGVLYGVADAEIFRISQIDGSVELLGTAPMPQGEIFMDISWDPVAERMYGISMASSSGPTNFWEINLTTGVATLVGALNIGKPSANGGLATTAEGVRYVDDGVPGGLYRLDGLDGTFLGPEGVNFALFSGMTIDWSGTGTCYHGLFNRTTARVELWTVDPETGAGTFAGFIGNGMSPILSVAVKPVPEPATLVGLLVLALGRRR